jgi:hypothetical protein
MVIYTHIYMCVCVYGIVQPESALVSERRDGNVRNSNVCITYWMLGYDLYEASSVILFLLFPEHMWNTSIWCGRFCSSE